MNIARSIVLCFALSAVGCAAVTTQTSSTTPTLVMTVPNPPPDPKEEEKPASPGPGYIWVAGYWDYIGGHHVWREGRWMQSKPNYEYVRARYAYDGHSWQFYVPHWHHRAVSTSSTQMAAAQQGGSAEGK